jgi:hypothetical protein
VQVGHPHCISVRTVERELLLRCCSAEEAESWRQAIISCSSAPLPASGNSVVAADVSSSGLASSTFSSSLSASHSKTTSDSLMAQDGDSLDASSISIGHRIMTEVSRDSSKSSCSGSSGAIPGWDGKKNSIGCVMYLLETNSGTLLCASHASAQLHPHPRNVHHVLGS